METLTAPLRSPLRARVERKLDLANIIGKLDCSRRESRNQDKTAMGGGGFDLGVGGVEKAQ